jgi:hypothetical protein
MKSIEMYSVFFLTGGSSNFVCKSLFSKYSFEDAQIKVEELRKMGYKSMAVKNGHVIGGYCSYSDFDSKEQALDYYNSLS